MKQLTMFAMVWAVSASTVLAQPVPLSTVTDPASVAAPASEVDQPTRLSPLFRDLARDLRRRPSLETAVVLGIAGGASFAIRTHDRTITTRFASSAAFDRVFEPGDVVGGGIVQVGADVATYAAGRVMHNPRVATIGSDLARAQIVSAGLTHGVKRLVQRMRPDGGRYSFPSGHTSSSFAFASVLGRHFGWKVAVPAHTLAGYVAASRLQENRHFLTDVAVGAAIGIVAGRAATIGRGPTRFVVSPVASRGVAGVAFTWQPRGAGDSR